MAKKIARPLQPLIDRGHRIGGVGVEEAHEVRLVWLRKRVMTGSSTSFAKPSELWILPLRKGTAAPALPNW